MSTRNQNKVLIDFAFIEGRCFERVVNAFGRFVLEVLVMGLE